MGLVQAAAFTPYNDVTIFNHGNEKFSTYLKISLSQGFHPFGILFGGNDLGAAMML